MSESYEIGHVEPEELNFVLSSFKRSFREACSDLRTSDYYLLQGAVCDELLSRFPLLVAARNHDGLILAWLMAEATPEAFILHYGYCKSPFRRRGLFKALLSHAIDALPEAGDKLVLTHRTRHYSTLVKYGFTYVPVGKFLHEVKS